MSEELRERRVLKLVDLFRLAERFGTPVAVRDDGTLPGVMHSAVYGVDDEAAEEAAIREAFFRGHAGQPFIAELQALSETEEGRSLLLEAYRRWQEEED